MQESRERQPLILAIEDHLETAEVYGYMVANLACRLHGLPSGRAGIEAALALRPDLVIVDMRLPDIDGRVVIEQLRNQSETRAVPIIVASASPADVQLLAPHLRNSIHAVLAKPFSYDEFIMSVATAIGLL